MCQTSMRRIKKCIGWGRVWGVWGVGGSSCQDDLDAPQACSGSGPLQSNQQLCRMEKQKGRAGGGREATDAAEELCWVKEGAGGGTKKKQFHFCIIDVKAILRVWPQYWGDLWGNNVPLR